MHAIFADNNVVNREDICQRFVFSENIIDLLQLLC
eukprot:XP_001709121.1 Hypothetical protein GL50803_39037 [Giardia lamblia ATCC 50803]